MLLQENYDVRAEELESIKAIFEEKIEIDFKNLAGKMPFPMAVLNIQVSLYDENLKSLLQSTTVSNLLPFSLRFSFPTGYPYESAPIYDLETEFLDQRKIQSIKDELYFHWDTQKDQVLFVFIDILQAFVDDSFSLIGNEIKVHDPDLYERLIKYDRDCEELVFQRTSFTCEICQLDVKGASCLKFPQCSHVFCNKCLRDFFFALINSGEVEKIHCPDFQCSKQFLELREKCLRLDNLSRLDFNFEEFKNNLMTPPMEPSLLKSILGFDDQGAQLFKRYMDLFIDHQQVLIAKLFPMRLVSCPRQNCPSMIFRDDMTSRLVICRQCQYAFCNTCRKSYHSNAIDCSKQNDLKQYHGISVEALELWLLSPKDSRERKELRYRYGHDLMNKVADEYEMDKLFNNMLADESSGLKQCPTCDLIIQRSDGCNKMKCSSCHTSFCNICGTYLDYEHPYDHFKNYDSPCYGKLFQGMPGTEDI